MTFERRLVNGARRDRAADRLDAAAALAQEMVKRVFRARAVAITIVSAVIRRILDGA